MIKIIDDIRKTLNLNPLVIYFLFSSEEKQKYEIIIDSLNQNNALTLGVFKFRAVTRSQDPELNAMLGDVIPANCGNMLVRFFDRTEEAFSYGLTDIDFSLPKKEIERRITAEVKDIARIDLRNLKDYAQSGSDQDDTSLFNEMAQLLEEALTHDIGSDLKSDFLSLYIDSNILGRNLPPGFMSDISRLKKWGKHKDVEVEGFFEKFNNLLEEYGISSEDESEEILTSKKKLKSDYYTRNEPENIPEFAIIVQSELKDKYEHEYDYSFVIAIEGEENREIKFRLVDSKIIYLSLLISSYRGQRIKRDAFIMSPKSNNPIQRWIKFAFERLSPNDYFESWVYRLCEKNERRLNNGKAQCKSAIEKALKDYPELNYYLQIQIDKKGIFVDNFYLNLKPEQIVFPSHWQLE